MKIYNYDRESGEFVGTSEADESPLEIGMYLIPAFATKIPVPDTKENEAAVFNVETQLWCVVPDCRNIKLWSKSTASRIEAKLGQTFDELNATQLEPDIEYPVWDVENNKWITNTSEKLIAIKKMADTEYTSHMLVANNRIAVLQDAIDLSIATASEIAALVEWKKYRVMLSRTKIDEKYPDVIWPRIPE